MNYKLIGSILSGAVLEGTVIYLAIRVGTDFPSINRAQSPPRGVRPGFGLVTGYSGFPLLQPGSKEVQRICQSAWRLCFGLPGRENRPGHRGAV